LVTEGYQVQVAMTWREGRKLLESNLPDLLIMDLNLPDGDGMDIIESLRGQERTADLPIVVTSAEDDTEHLIRGIKSGVIFFVPKPYDLEELVAKVRSAIFQRYQMKPGSSGTADFF
jgi:DNA-binding response OmpR family regulator